MHREVLPDVVRVTVELDREVPFYQERIEGPARLFFDLKGTKTVASLVDATFRYDSDIVRHIRLGRHPNSTTRVVLDLENVARYSVFTLYNPYRIVIDAERSGSRIQSLQRFRTPAADCADPAWHKPRTCCTAISTDRTREHPPSRPRLRSLAVPPPRRLRTLPRRLRRDKPGGSTPSAPVAPDAPVAPSCTYCTQCTA